MVRRALIALAAQFALAAPASACRLALVLAMDVSSSVDANEDALQRAGLASAFLDPNVQRAFLAGGDPVALAVYEWSGRYNQAVLQDWVMIDNAADLFQVAARIAESHRSHNDFPTALGYALGYGSTLLTRGPDCASATIDVSGDGINNEGFGPAQAYSEFAFDGVTVNGLIVNASEVEPIVELQDYYEQEVIRGPAAFVVVADGFEDFERAMEAKLIRELGARLIGRAAPTGRAG